MCEEIKRLRNSAWSLLFHLSNASLRFPFRSDGYGNTILMSVQDPEQLDLKRLYYSPDVFKK
jgi:hypothetical protein